MTYFERAGYSRPVSRAAADYLPGDLVAWDLGGGILHIGIVSDRKAARRAAGDPQHRRGAREEDILFRYTIIGHYRLPRRSARRSTAPSRHDCRRTLTPLACPISR